jgi:hypothetical protein
MKPNTDAVKSGDAFKYVIEVNMQKYNVSFSTDNSPSVSITYERSDGTKKTAEFMLDGYDADKKIGYQLVTTEDKKQWDEERQNEDSEVPDLTDAKLIQEWATQYEFPVIFICVYDYQGEFDGSKIADNTVLVYKELYSILETPALMKWAENLGYDTILLEELD